MVSFAEVLASIRGGGLGRQVPVYGSQTKKSSEWLDAKTELLDAKTELLDAKTELLDAKTELLDAKTELLDASSLSLGVDICYIIR